MGGYTGAPSALTEGLLFSSDTTAQVTKGSLSQARTTMQSCNSVTTAYTMGGSTDSSGLPAGAQSTTDGLTFSTDTTTQTTRGVLVTAKLASGSFNSLITGYASGGVDTSSVLLAETCGLTFVTDTTAQVTKGALTGNFARLSGFNSSLFGYSHAGSTSSFLVPVESAVVNSLTFSSDTTAQVTKGSLSQARYGTSSSNSAVIGYCSGGYTGAYVTTTDGLTFSTDTTTQTTRGVLSIGRFGSSGFQSGGII